MNFLPEGWRRATLGEILAPLEDGRTIHQGWSPQCEKEPSDDDSVWGVLKTTAVQPGDFQPRHNKRLPASLTPRPLLEVREGDVLVTSAGPRARCGVAALVQKTRPRLMLSGKMYRFRFDEALVDSRFGEAYLLSDAAVRTIDGMKTGISDSGLNLTHARFRKLPFPVPPLDEQRRIVGAIEEQFSRLDAADESLALAQMRASVFRGAMLNWLFTQDGIDWVELGQVARIESRLVDPAEYQDSPHIAPNHIEGRTGRLLPFATVRQDGVTSGKYLFKSGDILYSKIRPYLAKAVVVDFEGVCSADMYPIATDLDPRFLHFWLISGRFTALAAGKQGRSVLPKINREALFGLPAPSASFDVQQKLVAEVDRSWSMLDALEDELSRSRARSVAMRQAMLRDAFAGRLGLGDAATSADVEKVEA